MVFILDEHGMGDRNNMENSFELIRDNLYKINAGHTYTYKSLCTILGLQYYSGGNSKKRQLREIEQFMELEKVGRSYRVIKIYDTPLPGTVHGNEKYMGLLQDILIKYLSTIEPTGLAMMRHVYISPMGLAYCCGIVNEEYENINRGNDIGRMKELAEKDIQEKDVQDFCRRMYQFATQALKRALSRLENIGYIVADTDTFEIRKTEESRSGAFILSSREATKEEVRYIKGMRRKIFREMKEKNKITANSMAELNLKPKESRDFYDKVRVTIEAEKGWGSEVRAYGITVLAPNLSDIAVKDIEPKKRQLRKLVYDRMVEIAEKNAQKNITKEEIIDGDEDPTIIKIPVHRNGYLDAQKKLARIVILDKNEIRRKGADILQIPKK